jgi:transposase
MMKPDRVLVGIDVGKSHHVVIQSPDGEIQRESMSHRQEGFDWLKDQLEEVSDGDLSRVIVGIEGHNGHLLPLDHYLKQWGCELWNIDAKRLAHFRNVYGTPCKTDKEDAELIVHLLSQQTTLFKENDAPYIRVHQPDPKRRQLKRLARHQKKRVQAKTRAKNRLKQLLRSHCPDRLDGMGLKSTRFLRALHQHPSIRGLKRTSTDGFMAIEGIGEATAQKLKEAVRELSYDRSMDEANALVIEDLTGLILRYQKQIDRLDEQLEELAQDIEAVQWVRSFPGAGIKTAGRLVGEIQTIKRFNSQNALAAYLGVACVDDQSGDHDQARPIYPCNTIGKSAMMDLAHKMSYLDPESKSYYEKKLDEGKEKLDAKRRVARQLVKILYRMLTEQRKYDHPDQREGLKEAA